MGNFYSKKNRSQKQDSQVNCTEDSQGRPQGQGKPQLSGKAGGGTKGGDDSGGDARGGEQTTQWPSMPLWTNFIIAGTSGILATSLLHPADVLKTRMQLIGKVKFDCDKATLTQVTRQLIKKESYTGLYKGLSAALLRQFVYTSGRLGGFNLLLSYHKFMQNTPPDFSKQVAMGCAAGGVGAFLSIPAEVCLVRMMADGRLPKKDRRNYSNVFNAIVRIANEEGFGTLWRGASSTVLRAVMVSGAQLVTYAQIRERLQPGMGDNLTLFITASMISGLVATVVSMPADLIKTRIQAAPELVGHFIILRRVVVCEGFFSLWKGFVPAFFKIAPHTLITFLALEQFNKLYNLMVA